MTTTKFIPAEDLEVGDSFIFPEEIGHNIYVIGATDWNPNSVQPLTLIYGELGSALTEQYRTSHSPDEIVELV
jgi:hypothetical protein